MIRAAFFDIDGTLLPRNETTIPNNTANALKELQNKGVKIVLATGRHFAELAPIHLNGIEFDAYITMNGQYCTDQEKIPFFEKTIQTEDAKELVNMYNTGEFAMLVVEEKAMYFNRPESSYSFSPSMDPCPYIYKAHYEGERIYMASVFCPRSCDPVIEKRLQHVRCARWNEEGTDIISVDSGKKDGMLAWLMREGINPEETIAFGDADNDIDMLEMAGIGVAMGNGTPAAKAHADYVTDDCNDNGIAKALSHFSLF